MANDFGFFDEKPPISPQVKTKSGDRKLKDKEEFVITYRQTGIITALATLGFFILIALAYWPFIRLGTQGLLLFVPLIVIVPAGLGLSKIWSLWLLNRYIITTKRLILIKHIRPFKKVVMETPLERILNVSYKTRGLLSMMSGYGDVEVQVVGLMEPMILERVTNPAAIKDYLWDAHQHALNSSGESNDLSSLQQKLGYTKPQQKVL